MDQGLTRHPRSMAYTLKADMVTSAMMTLGGVAGTQYGKQGYG